MNERLVESKMSFRIQLIPASTVYMISGWFLATLRAFNLKMQKRY